MNAFIKALESLTTHQDYLWFLAALAWGGTAIGIWRDGDGDRRRVQWSLVWALANVASALVELVLLSIHHETPSYLGWDRGMSAAQCAATGALAWGAWGAARSDRTPRRILLGVGVTALWLTRNQWPVAGGFLAAGVNAAAVFSLANPFRPAGAAGPGFASDTRALRPALLAFLAWPLVATHGPLAHLTGLGRILEDYSHYALPASFTLACAGGCAAYGIWRARLAEAAGTAGREGFSPRVPLLVLTVWLVLGFALIVGSGSLARRDYENGLIARARTGVQVLDPHLVERALGDALQPGDFTVDIGRSGLPRETMAAPVTANADYDRLRGQLARIRAANPELKYVYLTTIRAGRVLIAATGAQKNPHSGIMRVDHAVDATDQRLLADGQTAIVGPKKDNWGAIVSVQSPLFAPSDGRLLGWLVFDLAASRWLAVFAQARLQMMAVIGLGVVIWALALAYELRRIAAEAIARREAAAEEANRMKSAFLATVSHELRTPIQSVLGYSELLGSGPLPENAGRWVAALHTHGQLMLQLVNDLIDIGALQSGLFRLQPRPVDLSRAVDEVVAAVRPRALAKGLALECHLAPPLPSWVLADPVRLRQVLLNLLANAVKFTVRGRVRLEVRTASSPVDAEAGAAAIEFVVSDTGPGIPPEDRSRLFQPFSRLASAEGIEGSGLGLALVDRLCSSMGGRVRLAETAGEGATFVATLPLPSAGDPSHDAVAESPRPAGAWNGVRILVAEDNHLVRTLLVEFLERLGASVTAVADGHAAIARGREGDFHAIILDWMMPGCDGLAVTRALRAAGSTPDRPFILGLSAHAGADAFPRAQAEGMNAFLAKPVNLASLAHVLSRAAGIPPPGPSAVAPTDAALIAGLQVDFMRELPALVREIEAAAASRDWVAVRSHTHYLKNGADLVGARALGIACQEVLDRREPPAPADWPGLAAPVVAAARSPFGFPPPG